MGMALLAATTVERAVYENVKNGKQAWDEVLALGLIVKDDGFYVLSDNGRKAVKTIHQQYHHQ
jgi:hypothetical protein